MAETANLSIISAGWSQYGLSGWTEGNNELYAGRSNGSYYFSRMAFDTNGLSISGEVTLALELTLSGTSNPYGTSLILTTSELTPAQVHALSTADAVKAAEGFVAYTDCASHTSSGNVAAGAKASYTLTAALKGNTPYYIYIRRRVGLSSSGVNGWTEWYNPAYSDEQAATVTLVLTYEHAGGVDHVHHNGAWRKGTRYIWHNGVWIRGKVNILHGGEMETAQAFAEIQGDVLYLYETGGATMAAAVSDDIFYLSAIEGMTPSISAAISENNLVIT